MRVGTVIRDGRTRAFAQSGGETRYFDAVDAAALIAAPDLSLLASALGPDPDPAELTMPILRPGKILCAGLNYHAHAAEVGKEAPEVPTLFAKFATALTGPRDEISLSPLVQELDWEAELAVIIGRPAHLLASDDEARQAIFGYAVVNDISARDWQRRTSEWLQGKTFDRTTPFGPWIVTADEIDPEKGLTVECLVDGDLRQSGTTADMIFSAPALVRYISQILTLEPGDVIATGTPPGVGSGRRPPLFLQAGETVLTRIEGIGELVNTVTPAAGDHDSRRDQA